ncbi:LADA_0F01288g1_1 [Lachancea dasiensis]|uniref:LADA_0F01288g1_1 n=1 Tax=Lachancea dasiensis TaxID=1072105 RepID=A0A1G4JHX3_9SACH|nr:LADA_0F01288g1_1 [Lachancea dasiensis]
MSLAPQQPAEIKKKPVSFSNILLGSALNMCEVTTLGQPLEVTKTTMAANRNLNFLQSVKHIWARGGVFGFYQGLIPWAWIEASTKGAALLFVAAEAEYQFKRLGLGNFGAGIMGGVSGGVAQAYLTMGFCTCMKTVEITKAKSAVAGAIPQSSWSAFKDIYKREGIRGINKGVNAVAIRQMTNWGSRFGFSRLVEEGIRKMTGKTNPEDKLTAVEKICASAIGGGLSAWNQPIEVIRVEMQSKKDDPNRPKKLGVVSAFKYIYQSSGLKGLYRGVSPRIGLGVWQTVFMVGFGDMAREFVGKLTGETPAAKH